MVCIFYFTRIICQTRSLDYFQIADDNTEKGGFYSAAVVGRAVLRVELSAEPGVENG